MSFFKKTDKKVTVVHVGDVLLIDGSVYLVETDHLKRLPIKAIGQR